MSTIIIFPDGYEFTIDTTTKDSHGRSATLTKHKVEKGTQVSDHRVKENMIYSMDGIISEFTYDKSPDFVGVDVQIKKTEIFFERIEQAYDNDELLKIQTSTKLFENMMITNYSIPRDVTQGKAVFFSLEFEEIRFAETKSIKVENVPKSAIQKNDPSIEVEKLKKESSKTKKRTSAKNNHGRKTLNPITISNKIKKH